MSNEAASQLAHLRWKGTTPEQRIAISVAMIAAKQRGKTKEQISAEARAASNARWKRVKSESQGVEESGSQGVKKGRRKPGGGRRKK
jgi:DNA-binding NtrC family response regulator